MADFALELMRRELVEDLHRLGRSNAAKTIVSCDNLEEVEAQSSVSSILSLSMEIDAGIAAHIREPRYPHGSCESDTGAWTMALHSKLNVPVFLLKNLLGTEQMGKVQEGWPKVLSKDFAVFTEAESTVKLQAKLWKLAGFID